MKHETPVSQIRKSQVKTACARHSATLPAGRRAAFRLRPATPRAFWDNIFGMFRRICVALLCLSAAAPAALLRIEVSERSDVLDGKAFGPAGPYERIVGKAYFAVDPSLPANQIITDIGKAPRNEKGLVEFSSDLYVLKPRDPARGNGAIFFEVSNRGRKGILSLFQLAKGSLDPRTEAEIGDGFLMEQGYTLVWLGWQFDVPKEEHLMRLYTPVIQGVTGMVRAEIVTDRREVSHSLADRQHQAYPVADPNDPGLKLTVRDRADGVRRIVPRAQWRIEGSTFLEMPGGFEPGKIYELVYRSANPAVVGLGPTAVRDLLSFLKYGGNDVTVLGDQHGKLKLAYGYGASQSGRFLRTFLYYGFNRDEKGRKVFDGLIPHIAGGGRGSFNHRFAQASRDGHPFMNLFYPTDIFPFTDNPERDPETGLTDGILAHAATPETTPKIFYTNSSYEYYGRAASLISTMPDGKEDAVIPATTRIYLFAGGQHGPAAFPPKRNHTQNLPNPNPYTLGLRALLVRLNLWVRDGVEPPPSLYPRLTDHNLTPLAGLQFPKIPGVALPTHIQTAYRVDYGPEFRSKGIVTIEPPKVGKPFPMLVPQVDQDGNEAAGVRMPDIQIPLATFTGWNLRSAEIGAPDELFSMVGSYIPFPVTKAAREQAHDPRLSIEERYANKAEYLQRLGAAARTLADRGYLLDRDVHVVLARGSAEWDYVHAGAAGAAGTQ